MSKSEILAELPNLKAEDRAQVFQRLCELQEEDLLNGAGPSTEEKAMLDRELAAFEQDRDPGTSWRETLKQIRTSNK